MAHAPAAPPGKGASAIDELHHAIKAHTAGSSKNDTHVIRALHKVRARARSPARPTEPPWPCEPLLRSAGS